MADAVVDEEGWSLASLLEVSTLESSFRLVVLVLVFFQSSSTLEQTRQLLLTPRHRPDIAKTEPPR